MDKALATSMLVVSDVECTLHSRDRKREREKIIEQVFRIQNTAHDTSA